MENVKNTESLGATLSLLASPFAGDCVILHTEIDCGLA